MSKDIIIAVNAEDVEYVDSVRVYNCKITEHQIMNAIGGVSGWRNIGKKLGYWDFFVEQIIADELNRSCLVCGKPLKPDFKSLNYTTKKWDEHTYFPCKCGGKGNKDLRISIG
jgi:hypothetical protein